MINVPRKETYIDWPFFIDPKGNIKFASKCNNFTLECKQSFRVRFHYCPKYKSLLIRGGGYERTKI